MFTPLRVTVAANVLLGFAALTYGQTEISIPGVEQLQATLRRLQAEIKNLQDTIVQLKVNRRNDAPPEVAQGATTKGPGPTTASASRAKQARAAYNDARRLEDQKLYRAAVDTFAEAIQLDPLNDAAFLHRGYCFHQLGDYTAAVSDFTQSLTLQPNSSRAYLARATANAAMGQRAPALDDTDEAIRRDPKSTEAYLLRGRLYQQQGDSQRAITDFTTAQTLSPKSESAYLGRAETYLRDGNFDEAMADCDAAVRLNANSFAGYLCRAHAYIQMGKSERAVEEISRASRAAQSLDLPLAFLNDTWRALDGKGAPPEPTVASGPFIPSQTMESASVVSATGTRASARAVPDQVDAENPVSLERLARTYTNQHNYAGALIMLNRAITLDPRRPASYNARGFTHLLLRHFDLAIADLSQAIQLNPAYGNAYHNRAVARRAVGDRKQAAEDDNKADGISSNARQAALAVRR